MEPDAATLPNGLRFEDRYEILGELGAGSSGHVYHARQLSTGQSVAIKLLSSREGTEESTRREAERFRRETQICAALSHTNIVGVIDSGETKDRKLYAVFAHVPGETMERVLSRDGAVSVRESVRLMTQVLEALHYAHAKGIVHRDLKPSNFMLSGTPPRRNAVVLDFGLGGVAEGRRSKEWENLTQSREFLGTPLYAAPEQLEGKAPTERSDLYSWGLIFLECLTGQHPFGEQGALARLVEGGGEVAIPRWLHDHRLGELLARVTALDPERHNVTAAFLIKELEEIAGAELPVAPNAPRESALTECGEPRHPTASSSHERRLSAIVSADVVGYSRLMAADEDSTVRMVKAYREEIELHVRQHRGRMDFTGDNFLAEFRSAIEAVRCALEIQHVLGALNAHLAGDRRMDFRIGIHLGDVRFEGERMFGTGVNIAARLEGLAEPGTLCISGAVREQLLGKLDLELEDLGEQSLKNIPDPVHAFRVRLEEETAGARPRSTRRGALGAGLVVLVALTLGAGAYVALFPPAPSTAPLTSMAVLPFDDLSPDGNQKWLSGGIAEELTESLSRIGELRVIARTSSRLAKASGADLPTIGEQLHVGVIVQGSVRRSGDQIGVTAQLIRVADESHLWSGRYDRKLDDVFAIEREIARAVAEAIRAELGVGTTMSWLEGARYVPNDVRAWELLRRGWDLFSTLRREEVTQAGDLFREAIAIDPDYLHAHSSILATHYLLWLVWDPREERMQLALESANRIREIDPTWYALQQFEGSLSAIQWDFEAAEERFVALLEDRPGDGTLHADYARVLADTGRIDEACTHYRTAIEVDPLHSWNWEYLAACERALGNYDAAIQMIEHALTLAPELGYHGFELGLAYHLNGMDAEALEAIVRSAWVDTEFESALRRAFVEDGWAGMSRALASGVAARHGDPCTWHSGYGAQLYARAGERDEMYRCLERAIAERGNRMLYLWREFWDPYRDDPRFQAILGRNGLAD
jgi:adenylate cyclase